MPINSDSTIIISEACDGFTIYINDVEYYFSQEDSVKPLVEVFKDLGFTSVTFEEDY